MREAQSQHAHVSGATSLESPLLAEEEVKPISITGLQRMIILSPMGILHFQYIFFNIAIATYNHN